TPSIGGQSLNDLGGGYLNDFMGREFWRFVLVQQYVAKLAETAIGYPPMQDPASFNLEAVKEKNEEKIRDQPGQYVRATCRSATASRTTPSRGSRLPTCSREGALCMHDFMARELWRFVFVQEAVRA